MLTSILSATYCWFSRGIPSAWPSIQVNLIYVLKFYSIDCTLDSPDFREPLRAIRDIFHCDIGFSRMGREHLWQRGESTVDVFLLRNANYLHNPWTFERNDFHDSIQFLLLTRLLHDSYKKQNLYIDHEIFILIAKFAEKMKKSLWYSQALAHKK